MPCTKSGMMRGLMEDVRYGMRILRSNPGPTAVAVLTLALGIAANTTVFGWIDTLMVHPFPGVTDGRELATIETVAPNGEFSNTAYRDYRDYRDRLKLVSGLAASLLNPFNLGSDENPQRVWGEYVSGNYFAVLGVKPARGRAFLPDEYGDKPGAYPVAVIGYRTWQKVFQGDPAVLGRTVRVNRHELTVVGIAPPEFHGTVPGLALEMWIPMVMAPQLNGQGEWLLTDRGQRQMWITARLKPGVTIEQARQEVAACARQLAETEPRTNGGFSAALVPVWKGHFGAQALLLSPLRILMAVCVVLFLIVGANVANLQLARATARQKEFSIRASLGAGSIRIVRQLLTESLALAILGALAGVPLAMWLEGSLGWLLPPVAIPLQLEIRLSPEIVGFTVLLCGASAVLTGLAPAVHTVRANLSEGLKEGGRSATAGVGSHRLRGALVICEVALALVALVGTGLFARSFQNARAINPGLDPRNVYLTQFQLATFCRTPEQRTQFCLRLHDRLKSVPGITGVSYGDTIPLALGSKPWSSIEVEGYLAGRSEDMRVGRNIVAPGFFDVFRIPLMEGRDFTEQDDRNTAPVMIVNESFARRYFAGQNPVGRRVRTHGRWLTIIGMARDSKYMTVTEAAAPFFYMPFRQMHGGEFWIAFFTRANGPARDAIAAIRREAGAVDPNAAVSEVIPFEQHMEASLYGPKVAAAFLAVLGGVSLLLAAVGMYGVLAYSVSQRRHEFGIRMALGAKPGDVLGMVIRQGLGLTAAGVLGGAALAFAGARVVRGLLVNVSAADPVTFGGAALFLGALAVIASYVPARRATRVSPVVALRRE